MCTSPDSDRLRPGPRYALEPRIAGPSNSICNGAKTTWACTIIRGEAGAAFTIIWCCPPPLQNEFLEKEDSVAGLFGQAPSSTILCGRSENQIMAQGVVGNVHVRSETRLPQYPRVVSADRFYIEAHHIGRFLL